MSRTERSRNLSVGEYFLRKYRQRPRAVSFDGTTREEFEAWKPEFQARLLEALGPFPEPSELDAEVVEVVDEGEYWRERVLFNSEPEMAVVAYVLVPKDLESGERRPAILACHGHGYGKDDVIGLHHGEKPRVELISDLNYDYARQFALRGYVVMAPDWRGFGERRAGGIGVDDHYCDMLFIKGALLGLNLLTLNVWDARSSITYLQSRADVDADRIGCAGLSYGGLMTLFTAAVDERVRCAVVGGYLNKYGTYALGMAGFCGAQIPPGILEHGEMSDVACLIAPRALLIESGTMDPFFPIEATREAAGAVRRCYEVAGVPERFDVDEFEGEHRWSGAKAYGWMANWL